MFFYFDSGVQMCIALRLKKLGECTPTLPGCAANVYGMIHNNKQTKYQRIGYFYRAVYNKQIMYIGLL